MPTPTGLGLRVLRTGQRRAARPLVTNGFNRDPNPDVYVRMIHAGSLADATGSCTTVRSWSKAIWPFAISATYNSKNVSAAWAQSEGCELRLGLWRSGRDGNLDLVYTNFQSGVSLFRNDNDTGHRVIIDLRGPSPPFWRGAIVRIESALGVQVRQLWLARGYSSSSEPMVHFGLGRTRRSGSSP